MSTQVKNSGNYISEIKFNTGYTMPVKQDDIVIFVGPNNSGKSQSLNDIYSLSSSPRKTTVISSIVLNKDFDEIKFLLKNISSVKEYGDHQEYQALNAIFPIYKHTSINFYGQCGYSDFRNLLIINLSTINRLSICTSPKSIIKNEMKTHPIHFAAFDSDYRKWLSENFKKAFGEELIPDTHFGSQIPLRIGSSIKFEDNQHFEDEQDRQEKYAEIINGYKSVHEQGDGIKSFTGILLYLMLDYYRTYLIDEPESFLHPPQAYIMGQIIGKTLSNNKQAFISTHSEEIIKGLLDVCPERVKIVRITREGNKNNFSILDNEQVRIISEDPLLKHSNILSGLFYKSVVLCESDSDCKMYSIIEEHNKQLQGKFIEALFIHCGGKQRMSEIASALKNLNIKITLIPDMDIINNEKIFHNTIEPFGIEWKDIESDYKKIVSNFNSSKEQINRNEVKKAINKIIEDDDSKFLSNKEISAIKEKLKIVSKWDAIKKYGKNAIPAGESTISFNNIDNILKEHRIFIVPVGELENFVKAVNAHGPEWVNKVLELYPDLNDKIYSEIKTFINEMNL